ncbi:MAG: aldolase [Spirochaetes bacterium]|nr:aldolase [Spirochaetota bacterium]
MENLKQRLAAGPVYGTFSKTSDPFFIEILGKTGFDFAILDCEHGPNDPRTLLPLILAARCGGLLPIVRVSSLSAPDLQRVLDLGVAGVQIPQIATREDAEQAVKAVRFHPSGERGVCRYVRAANYSLMEKPEYFAGQNAEVALIIHIEGAEGLRNLDAILGVEGLDVIFIGPYDLSQSLGVPGEIQHPKVVAAVQEIAAKCRRAGAVAGIFTDSVEAARGWRDAGIGYLAHSVDVGLFASACRGAVAGLRSPRG